MGEGFMWKQILLGIGPLILAAIPATRAIAPIVPVAVAAAEDMIRATGSEKKAAAMQLVEAGVTATNVAAGHEAIDPSAARAVAAGAIDLIVATTNLWSRSTVANMAPIS
jgi:hypothetical protein